MRYDSEHKERTRQRVLSEAAAAIRAVGPDGIGVAGVMGQSGADAWSVLRAFRIEGRSGRAGDLTDVR